MFLGAAQEVRWLASVHRYFAHHVQVRKDTEGPVYRYQPYVTPFLPYRIVKLGGRQMAGAFDKGFDDCPPLRRQLVSLVAEGLERCLLDANRCHSSK